MKTYIWKKKFKWVFVLFWVLLPNLFFQYTMVWVTVIVEFLPNLTLDVQTYNKMQLFIYSADKQKQTRCDLKS